MDTKRLRVIGTLLFLLVIAVTALTATQTIYDSRDARFQKNHRLKKFNTPLVLDERQVQNAVEQANQDKSIEALQDHVSKIDDLLAAQEKRINEHDVMFGTWKGAVISFGFLVSFLQVVQVLVSLKKGK